MYECAHARAIEAARTIWLCINVRCRQSGATLGPRTPAQRRMSMTTAMMKAPTPSHRLSMLGPPAMPAAGRHNLSGAQQFESGRDALPFVIWLLASVQAADTPPAALHSRCFPSSSVTRHLVGITA